MHPRSVEGREYDSLRAKAHQRAMRRVVDLHREEFETILADERAKLGLDRRSPLKPGPEKYRAAQRDGQADRSPGREDEALAGSPTPAPELHTDGRGDGPVH